MQIERLNSREWLTSFVGDLVAIKYKDGENRISSIKADVIQVLDDFIIVHTLKNEITIRVSEIVKIERPINQGGTSHD